MADNNTRHLKRSFTAARTRTKRSEQVIEAEAAALGRITTLVTTMPKEHWEDKSVTDVVEIVKELSCAEVAAYTPPVRKLTHTLEEAMRKASGPSNVLLTESDRLIMSDDIRGSNESLHQIRSHINDAMRRLSDIDTTINP